MLTPYFFRSAARFSGVWPPNCAMMDKLQIPMPESGMAVTVEDALEIANKIGYPVMVRPSYVLGGRGKEVVHDDEAMTFYMRAAVGVTPDRPILIDRFLHLLQ